MKIQQLSLFLENRPGHLSAICRTLAEAGRTKTEERQDGAEKSMPDSGCPRRRLALAGDSIRERTGAVRWLDRVVCRRSGRCRRLR